MNTKNEPHRSKIRDIKTKKCTAANCAGLTLVRSGRIKTGWILALAGLLLLSFSGSLFAGTFWLTGTVTKEPWVEKYRHIEMDDVKYTFMKTDVRMTRHFEKSPGIWQEENITLKDIYEGQEITIRIQGHRIYELFIEER